MKVLRFLGRAFVKITGFIPYLFVISPRCRYENETAKKEWKKNKEHHIQKTLQYRFSLHYSHSRNLICCSARSWILPAHLLIL